MVVISRGWTTVAVTGGEENIKRTCHDYLNLPGSLGEKLLCRILFGQFLAG